MKTIAFITSYGMDKGGTEKFLQTVAALLPKDRFMVDYYYINTDLSRVSNVKIDYLKRNKVNIIPYECRNVISRRRYIRQVGSNFFSVFKGADIIITGSCGYPEEPMSKIKNIPIIQTIHYVCGHDEQFNISRTLHISEFSRDIWVNKGGDKSRIGLISHPIIIPEYNNIDIRKQLGIDKKTFVYGLHQRNSDKIFSPLPLEAYARIESAETAFIMCGGSKKYREQSKELGLENAYFIEATDSNDTLYSFLDALDVYTHGRLDGELNSTALAEAMYFGLPIVTHPSSSFNGHLEVVKDNGFVANNVEEYSQYMEMLKQNSELYAKCSKASRTVYMEKYDPNVQMERIISIIYDVLQNPYPFYYRRKILGIRNDLANTIKIVLNRI